MMSVHFAEQFGTGCIRIDGNEEFEEVVEFAYEAEAYYDDGEDECLVIQFPGRPPELYTREALVRSLRSGDTK
jgi:hypothetical protein